MMYVVKKDLAKIFILAVLAVILVGATFVFTNAVPPKSLSANEIPSSVAITIQDLYSHKAVPITKNETVYQLLQTLNASDPNLKLATKEYSGMGILITAMGAHTNGDGKMYWQYKVNGIMPQIGADSYKLQGGEQIEWFFAPSRE